MTTKIRDLQGVVHWLEALEQRAAEKRKVLTALKSGNVIEAVCPTDGFVIANGLPPIAVSALCEAAEGELKELNGQIDGLLGSVTIDARRYENGWRPNKWTDK